ncbi:173_t:CDS:2 [Acaulospora morrowiae]|uniref:173_t:CDS:1 n=1 Tax=Acaulospora morrowiae TaxID=94023 RepID=A0A9N9BYP2_9GLOM|nr:173_t:CDS:2 [Acaulospora morrowiae]
METRIGCAIKACNEFVKNLHRDELDRGCVASFNNTMVIRQSFTGDEMVIHRSLNRLIDIPDGGTRLYDSMVDIVRTFRRDGDRTRPWILVVVTDGDDNSSYMSLERAANEVSQLFTRESSNFLFVLGVGESVDSTRMQEMASKGNFIYIPVKYFSLLEYAFLTLAYQVSTSLSLSVSELSVGNISATWTEVQRNRELSRVAIDYALLIDVSGSMNVNTPPPPPKCFAGHDLEEERHGGDWWCDICGEDGETTISQNHCNICNFDACSSHCESGRKCTPKSYCRNSHPLIYMQYPKGAWLCNECKRSFYGRRLRCHQCAYQMCSECLETEELVTLMAGMSTYFRN